MDGPRDVNQRRFRFRIPVIAIAIHTALVIPFAALVHMGIRESAESLMGWYWFMRIDYLGCWLLPNLGQVGNPAVLNIKFAAWFALAGAIQWGGFGLMVEALLWESRNQPNSGSSKE